MSSQPKPIVDHEITASKDGNGAAFEMKRGQRIRVIGRSTVDFVVFNADNLSERFSQARTKSNQAKIFITKGDVLFSKHNNVMMTILEDTWPGFHDLQKGMCDRKRHEMVFLGKAKRVRWEDGKETQDTRRWEDLPARGCQENLTTALEPWNILPENIPNPMNLFSHKKIDGETGLWWDVPLVLEEDAYVDLRAEMDLVVAGSHHQYSTTRIQIYDR